MIRETKMNNVAIVTLTRVYNYGNSLQNYATINILSSINYNAETILYDQRKIKEQIKDCIKSLIRYTRCREQKKRKFLSFEKRYLHVSRYKNLYISLNKAENRYFKFIVGSDQVWNPTWYSNILKNAYLLTFTEQNKKISFSASFGIEELPDEWIYHFAHSLCDFKAISVREEAGAKIVKELTGRDAIVLVDPTMLLTKEEWRKVVKKPKGAKEGYILTYFLSPKCDAAREKLEEIRDGRKVYELLNDEDKVAGTAGPSEFLWLFDHADLILTDSFHACVFSFLFNKPFVVYDRNWDESNMNSRLETLLSKFHLERKYAGSGLENDIWEHDYEEGYKQLEIERETAMNFLKEALED